MRTMLAISLTASLLAAAAVPSATAAERMHVQVREGQLRSAPGFLSRVEAIVPYTETVTVLETRADWLRVRTGSRNGSEAHEGWMHSSALTPRRLTLAAGDRDAQQTVSSDEQALAGRGFNAKVEAEFKDRQALDFSPVDAMEAIVIPPAVIKAFLREGGVIPTSPGGEP